MPLNFNFSPYKQVEKFANDINKNEIIKHNIDFYNDIEIILFQSRFTYKGIQAMGKQYGDFCAIENGIVKDTTNCKRYKIDFRYKENQTMKNIINKFLSEFDKLYNSDINDDNVDYVMIPQEVLDSSKKFIKDKLNQNPNDIVLSGIPILPQNRNSIQQYQPKAGIVEIKEYNLNKTKALLLQVRNNSDTMSKRNVGPRQRQFLNSQNQKNIAEILKLLSNQ